MYREGEGAGAGSLMGLDTPRDTPNLTMVGAGDHERILSGLAQGSGGRFESVPAVAVACSRSDFWKAGVFSFPTRWTP